MTTSDRPSTTAVASDTVPISRPMATSRAATAPKLSPQRTKVFEYMTDNPHGTARECAAATGMPVGSVRQQLGHLRSAGLIPGRVVREQGPSRAKVFQYMNANPRATAKECAAATGLSFSCVRQHQFRLRTAGLLPPVSDGALRGENLRALIARHETSCRRLRTKLEAVAAREGSLPSLLEPALRRRQRATLQCVQARLRHHEGRLAALLELLIREGAHHESAPPRLGA